MPFFNYKGNSLQFLAMLLFFKASQSLQLISLISLVSWERHCQRLAATGNSSVLSFLKTLKKNAYAITYSELKVQNLTFKQKKAL
jgi:hypothetical protein